MREERQRAARDGAALSCWGSQGNPSRGGFSSLRTQFCPSTVQNFATSRTLTDDTALRQPLPLVTFRIQDERVWGETQGQEPRGRLLMLH